MIVEEVMSTELVTCDVGASVREATERMLRNRVGSVIVTDGRTPAGIATEADVLYAGYAADEPLSTIPLRKAMTSPVVTIRPSATLRTATDRMRSESVKKLVVTEEMQPVGIVTTQDIADNYGQIRREVRDLAADATNWSNRSDRP
ncbi:CBS domain-containing protein [Halorubrum sp. BV1]|uniref:CBS domain-containing protein n=1 Tax=Halorubrum sp. BV1 TaxID=1498500 RepID=UPI0006785E05|nr:CBS domain-containing protein [Halorubrum sp. BV1]